jgi:hypothetical protein
MVFFSFIIPFLVLMVLAGNRYQRGKKGMKMREGLKRMMRAMKVAKLH